MNDRFVGMNAEVIHHVYIENSSTGAGRTGLAYNTAGLAGGMAVPDIGGGVAVTFETISTLGEYEAPSSDSHVRFKEVDAAILPGVYEIQLPAAYFLPTLLTPFTLSLRGASAMKTTIVQIQKSIPVTAEGLVSFGLPVLGGTATTITIPQLDANTGADGVYDGIVLTVNKGDGSEPQQIGVITSSVISAGQTLCGILTSKPNGQWWWIPGVGDTVDLKLSASPLVVSPQQIADYVLANVVESSISASSGLVNDSGTQLTAITVKQALALMSSSLAGKLTGANSATITIKPAGKGSSSARITATVDSNGNRQTVNLRVPD